MTFSICARQRMAHACLAATTLLGSLALPATAWSQAIPLTMAAGGVESYDQSAERCYYAAGVEERIRRLDDYMLSVHGYQWTAMRQRLAAQLPMALGARRMLSQGQNLSEDQLFCDAMATPIVDALTFSQVLVAADVPGLEDRQRLSTGKGQVITEPE